MARANHKRSNGNPDSWALLLAVKRSLGCLAGGKGLMCDALGVECSTGNHWCVRMQL